MSVTCVLEGKAIDSLDDLYDALARQLDFPDYFGHNLDALWDLLSTDIEGPFQIIWEESAASKLTMGDDFERVATLFLDLEQERDDFQVTFH